MVLGDKKGSSGPLLHWVTQTDFSGAEDKSEKNAEAFNYLEGIGTEFEGVI